MSSRAPICTTIHFIATKSKLCIRVSLTHPWWSELKNCVFVRMRFPEHANRRKTTRETLLSCQLRERRGHQASPKLAITDPAYTSGKKKFIFVVCMRQRKGCPVGDHRSEQT